MNQEIIEWLMENTDTSPNGKALVWKMGTKWKGFTLSGPVEVLQISHVAEEMDAQLAKEYIHTVIQLRMRRKLEEKEEQRREKEEQRREKEEQRREKERKREEREAKKGEQAEKENRRRKYCMDYLRKYLRVQVVNEQVVVSLHKAENITYFGTNLDIPRSTDRLLANLATINGEEHVTWSDDWDELFNDEEETKPKDAYVQSAVRRIIQHEAPECIIPANTPLLSWGGQGMCSLDPSLLQPGPTPAWDEFLSRVSHPEELMAFIYKCFNPDDYGREMYWGYSRGHSGQSTVWSNVIGKVLERISITIPDAKLVDKFTEGSCYRKRLVLMAEVKNPNFVDTGLVRRLTGNDVTTIREMYSKPFQARVYARVVAFGNIYPRVNILDNSILTRLRLFSIKGFEIADKDPTVGDRLYAELWSFLYRCREVEANMCGHVGGAIPLSDSMRKLIVQNCLMPEHRTAINYCENRLLFSPNERCNHRLLSIDYERVCKISLGEDGVRGGRINIGELVERYLAIRGCSPEFDKAGFMWWNGVRMKTKDEIDAGV